MVESIIDTILPIIISILEMMGILIITIGSFRAFYHYVRALLTKDAYPVKHQFANSMATGLEFKLAAEILKTVLIYRKTRVAQGKFYPCFSGII